MRSTAALPSFENPPVVEVVCGVQFKSLDRLLIPHFGLLWEKFKPEYSACQEAPPLMPAIERFDGPEPTEVEFPADPPLPRVWLVHRNNNGLIQVQRDRFLHNWKKVRLDDAYPRYAYVKQLFAQHLETFERFLADSDLGSMLPRQYEMTYVNQIPRGQGWDSLSDLGTVFPDFCWRDRPDRFLGVPEGRHLRFNFGIPDESARMHVTIRNAVRREDGIQVALLELTVRGYPEDPARTAMWEWFDHAREWIVRGFADLTGDQIQNDVWRRMQ